MSPRSMIYVGLAVGAACFAGAAPENTLKKLPKLPAGLSPQVSAALNPEGLGVESPAGTVCEVWLAKDVALKPAFKPTLNVKYPFSSGQLIGVLRVGDKFEFGDFRGQPVKAGVYTLRYGQQPTDGNHIGTSDLSDFLLALPAGGDLDPKPLDPLETLHKTSATATGTNHPAIFSLLPAETAVTAPTLAKDDDKNFWVLGLPVNGNDAGKKVSIPLRLVVIGKSEG